MCNWNSVWDNTDREPVGIGCILGHLIYHSCQSSQAPCLSLGRWILCGHMAAFRSTWETRDIELHSPVFIKAQRSQEAPSFCQFHPGVRKGKRRRRLQGVRREDSVLTDTSGGQEATLALCLYISFLLAFSSCSLLCSLYLYKSGLLTLFPPSFSLPFPSYAILLSLQVSMRSMLGKLLSCLFGLSSTRPLYLIRFIPSHCFLSHPYQLIMIRFSVEGKCPCYLFHSQQCNSLFDEKRITYSSLCSFTWCPTGFDSENVCYAQTLSSVKRFKMQALVGALITCSFQLVWSLSGC